MNDKYKIIDERLNEDFKLKTFFGFQKKKRCSKVVI